jgi:hypothetical protein
MKADKIAHKHFPFLLYQTLLKVLSLALKYELSTEWTIVPGELSSRKKPILGEIRRNTF